MAETHLDCLFRYTYHGFVDAMRGGVALAGVRVAVAMSGGVDSSVALYLLLKRGYEVVGLTMKLLDDYPWGPVESRRPFGTLDMARDAADVCHKFGVPHYTVNLAEEFEKEVITPFVKDYSLGRTPNPCVLCNRTMKFGRLLKKARQMGAEFVATGHYVRAVKVGPNGDWADTYDNPRDTDESRTYLARGKDRSKDQTYALYDLSQDMLSHAMFPLGNLEKRTVRDIARDEGFSVADRPDSQEICFVSSLGYREFLSRRGVRAEPGPIMDAQGARIGDHEGLPFYTIGQRKGLGLARKNPTYVVGMDMKDNVLFVGDRDEAYSGGCVIRDVNLIACDGIVEPVFGTCMVRYRGAEVPAEMTPHEANPTLLKVRFETPLFAVTPGQALVFYQNELVFGGGIID